MDTRYYKFVKRLDETHRQVTEYGLFGIVNDKGLIVAPIRYEEIISRVDGYYDVRVDNRWGIINVEGDEIASLSYKSPICFNEKGYAIVESADGLSVGVLKNDGTVIVPIKYSFIEEVTDNSHYKPYKFESPLFYVHQSLRERHDSDEKDYRIGVYNIKGEMIAPIKYESFIIKGSYLLGERSGYYDLYDGLNNRGILLGGFHHFYHHNDTLFFYYGGYYTSYTDRHDKDHVIFVERDGVWIITDLQMTSILKDDKGIHRDLKGQVYDLSSYERDSLNKIYTIFPKCMTFIRDEEWPDIIDSYIRVSNWAKYLIDEKTGDISDTFEEIRETGIRNVFFVEKYNGGCGILQGVRLVKPTIYFAFTNPVNGYSFGAKMIDEDIYNIELINLHQIEDVRIAYKGLSRDEVMELFWNQNLLINPIHGEEGIKAIRIIRDEKIEKDFGMAISSEDAPISYRNYSNWKERYWFPNHYYMREIKEEVFDDEEDNDESMSLHDYLHQWDQYADIAFEGYSRLELGLD